MIAVGWIAQRTQRLHLSIALPNFAAAAFYLAANWVIRRWEMQITAIGLLGAGFLLTISSKAPMSTVALKYSDGPGQAISISAYNTLVHIGAFLAPAYLGWIGSVTHGDYTVAFTGLALALVLAGVVVVAL